MVILALEMLIGNVDMVTNLHLISDDNVGDEYCSPYHYFDGMKRFHLRKYQATMNELIIYGGGAISQFSVRHQAINKTRGILWGVGLTERNKLKTPHHPQYKKFLLSGIRDYNAAVKNRLDWVPCASCMSEVFNDIPDPTTDVVFYGHKKLLPFNQLNNDEMDLHKVIKHLASGEIVVTSSYHGVYWATLLGKKVICLPFGSKFFGFKHPPAMIKKHDVRNIKHVVRTSKLSQYPDALEECREKNLEFWEKVKCVT